MEITSPGIHWVQEATPLRPETTILGFYVGLGTYGFLCSRNPSVKAFSLTFITSAIFSSLYFHNELKSPTLYEKEQFLIGLGVGLTIGVGLAATNCLIVSLRNRIPK